MQEPKRIPVTQIVTRPRTAYSFCVRFPIALTPDDAMRQLIQLHAPKGF